VLSLLWAASQGNLDGFRLEVRPAPTLCVVVSARGYPGDFPKGDPIGLPHPLPPGVSILHAGTARDDAGRLVSSGGRVLNVVSTAESLGEAAKKAYAACERIDYAPKHYRMDIGARQLERS